MVCLSNDQVIYHQLRHNVGSYLSSLSTSLGSSVLSRHNNVGPLGTLPVSKLRFSMLMGAILIVQTAQALEVFSAIQTVNGFVDSQDLLAFQTTCMLNYLQSCMV